MATIVRIDFTGVSRIVVTITASDGRSSQFDLDSSDGRRMLAALMTFNGLRAIDNARELVGLRYLQMEL